MNRLDPLFMPRGIAVIGASRDPAKMGAVMMRSLATFPGEVVGINPRDVDTDARRFASVVEATAAVGPIDLAILCVPAKASAQALEAAALGGIRAAVVCSGGFAETGEEGAIFEKDLLSIATDAGIALLGPNTSGFLAPARGLVASFMPGAAAVPAGPVAVVAASGGIQHALAFLIAEAGLGVSLSVGLGNAIDVSAADLLVHLQSNEQTRVVALHIESVDDGAALVDAVRTITPRIPVVALVVGKNDVAEFAQSHTGALATSWRTTRAALRHAGAVLVDDERQLVDAVSALSAIRLDGMTSPAVGVVTAQAGPGLLHIDGLRGRGVVLPPLTNHTRQQVAGLLPPMTYQANPVDTGRPGPSFGAVIDAVANDPSVDLVSAYALVEPDVLDLSMAVRSSAGSLVVGMGGPPEQVNPQRRALRAIGVPSFTSPTGLTNAVVALIEDSKTRAQAGMPLRTLTSVALPEGPMDEDCAKEVLDVLGISTLPRRACINREEAHIALDELPGPLAVKILDARIAHKSDIGGVHLGIRDVADLDIALDALEGIGAKRFLLESMAPAGIDLLVGATRDPVFGPMVLVGLGGVTAEALADVAVAPAPLAPATAGQLIDELAGRALLDGFRGGPVVDQQALGEVLAVLGALLVEHSEIQDIEINPLRVTADGMLALDAVITRNEGDTAAETEVD
ncbi:acetate--CoA ligase family protein [bacterium RCC_150]